MSKRYWAVSAILCSLAPLPSSCSDGPLTHTVFAGLDLNLENANGSCALRYVEQKQSRSQDLGIPWPCQFHVDQGGSLRSVAHGRSHFVLVESSAKPPDSTTECLTQLRGLRLSVDRLSFSEHTEKAASCPPFQWDSYLFTGIFDKP